MFDSEVIDVSIGMALLFLFMSLIATAIREIIENFMQSRARDLERGIKEMLQDYDPERETWRSWPFGLQRADAGPPAGAGASASGSIAAKDIYEHPVIMSLFKGRYVPGNRKLPAYIPRESFALAVLDVVAGASKNGHALSLQRLRSSLNGTPNPVQRVILTVIDTAESDLGKIQTSIEKWYDASMDRVSGWYTKRTARILAAIGFAGAVFYNVDAITIAERLITDKNLRAAAVAQAAMVTAPEATASEKTKHDDEAAGANATAGASSGRGGSEKAVTNEQDGGAAKVARLAEELSRIGFPIGWTWIDREPYPIPQACEKKDPRVAPPPGKVANDVYVCDPSYRLFPPLIGWIITALAIMLGAPFWFDVLNKFMIVRSTIKPAEKSPDEASVDRQSTDATGPPSPTERSVGPSAHAATGSDAGIFAAAASTANLAIATGAFKAHQWEDPAAMQPGII